ncbi:MAG: hypothetical protein WBG69_08135, partial [Arcobacteraceae bacterium]
MSFVYKILSFIILAVFFSGCLSSNINSQTKKEIIPDAIKIKQQQNCTRYTKKINYAFSYVTNEFEKAYFQNSDVIGAKAQLFLIENHAKTIFATNINDAQDSYNIQYDLAQKERCDIA